MLDVGSSLTDCQARRSRPARGTRPWLAMVRSTTLRLAGPARRTSTVNGRRSARSTRYRRPSANRSVASPVMMTCSTTRIEWGLAAHPDALAGKLGEELFELPGGHLCVLGSAAAPRVWSRNGISTYEPSSRRRLLSRWLILWCNENVSRRKLRSLLPVMRRRCRWPKTSATAMEYGMPPVAAWECGSTGLLMPFTSSGIENHRCFRWYNHNGWVDFAFRTEMG